jgi:sulfur-carrier protein
MGDAPGLVTVRLPQALAEYAGGARSVVLPVDGEVSLGEVLDTLSRILPAVGRRVRDETGSIRRFVNVYVGDDECRTLEGLRTPVAPGTELYVIPSVAGGAGPSCG